MFFRHSCSRGASCRRVELRWKARRELIAAACAPRFLRKAEGVAPKSRAEGAGKSFVTLQPGFESDIQDRRARRQEQPGAAIQPKPPLMRSRRFADHLHRKPMKLPPGKAGGPRHRIDGVRSLRRTEVRGATARPCSSSPNVAGRS